MVAWTCSPLVFTDVKTCLFALLRGSQGDSGWQHRLGMGAAQRTDDHWPPLKRGHSTRS